MAQPLPTLLERTPRSTRRLPGGRLMPTITKPSLTIKRRFNAAPAKVFGAWTDPEKVKRWIGPGEVKALRAEIDARAGGRYRWVIRPQTARSTMSAASTAK